MLPSLWPSPSHSLTLTNDERTITGFWRYVQYLTIVLYYTISNRTNLARQVKSSQVKATLPQLVISGLCICIYKLKIQYNPVCVVLYYTIQYNTRKPPSTSIFSSHPSPARASASRAPNVHPEHPFCATKPTPPYYARCAVNTQQDARGYSTYKLRLRSSITSSGKAPDREQRQMNGSVKHPDGIISIQM